MKVTDKYKIITEEIHTKPGCWSYTKVCVMLTTDDGMNESLVKIGEYTYNYPSKTPPFYPFKQGDKEYALFSTNYSTTRVMSLPDCTTVAAEGENQPGFCPVEFYVPTLECLEDEGTIYDPKGQFGFVMGCIWGSAYEIRLLNLKKISSGAVEVINLNYHDINPFEDRPLKELISMEYWNLEDDNYVYLASPTRIDLNKYLNNEKT